MLETVLSYSLARRHQSYLGEPVPGMREGEVSVGCGEGKDMYMMLFAATEEEFATAEELNPCMASCPHG